MGMNKFTIVFQRCEEGGFTAHIKEVPSAISEGETAREAASARPMQDGSFWHGHEAGESSFPPFFAFQTTPESRDSGRRIRPLLLVPQSRSPATKPLGSRRSDGKLWLTKSRFHALSP